jgi:hypothetical protein
MDSFTFLYVNGAGRQQEATIREDNIKTDLEEEEVDWIYLAQDRVIVNTVINLRVPYNVVKFFRSWAAVSFSSSTRFHWVAQLSPEKTGR